MADNYYKLWLQKTSNQMAVSRALESIQATGQALPCSVVSVSGSIVTVKFEVNASPWTLPNIAIPKAESPWVRMPTQVGDKGWTVPADVYLGGISGLGGGTAGMTRPGNLCALVFVPISNKSAPPIDQNAAQIQGPNGVINRTTSGTTSSVVTNTSGTTVTFGSSTLVVNASSITMTAGGKTVVLNASGFTIDGDLFETHLHSGVTTGQRNLWAADLMRTYGRITNEDGSKTWVQVNTDANGYQDDVYLTTLAQCLKLNLGESPFYANFGIPQYQTIVTQVFPDYYVMQTQTQFSPYFASLTIMRASGSNPPVYNVAAVTHSGAILNPSIPT